MDITTAVLKRQPGLRLVFARHFRFLLTSALLASCAPLPPEPALTPTITAGSPLDLAYYRALARSGRPVLRIDPHRSLISVTVRRGGALARLGHDHAITSATLDGYVAPQQGRADLAFRLDQMIIDEPDARAAAGLERQPSPQAIEGTRINMLSKVLDAERYPYVSIRIARASRDAQQTLATSITLHGVSRSFLIPATLRYDSDGSVTASGSVNLLQTDFGLVPFSVMGGAIAVLDQMEVRFRLVAAPSDDNLTGDNQP
jgi:hypothetical protein